MTPLLENQVCVIAGTTGIGGASARLFASEGAKVVAIGRSEDNAQALSRSLHTAEHLVLCEDLTAPGAEDRIVSAALDKFGNVDVLFHVAGISGRQFGDGPLADCTDEGWDSVMAVNLRAMMRLNRACLRHWLGEKRAGVILNMASVLGFSYVPAHFQTVGYAAAKAAIIGMSQHAAGTYAANGIRINVIAPGLVDTPMAARATQNEAILELMKRKQPLTAAPLTDEDCARAALYLCSSLSAGVTGIVLPVDGGWSVCG